jgi:hypothetical protein
MGYLALPVTVWLPKLQSFRGKRITATSTYLFKRLGWSATTLALYSGLLHFGSFLTCHVWSEATSDQT